MQSPNNTVNTPLRSDSGDFSDLGSYVLMDDANDGHVAVNGQRRGAEDSDEWNNSSTGFGEASNNHPSDAEDEDDDPRVWVRLQLIRMQREVINELHLEQHMAVRMATLFRERTEGLASRFAKKIWDHEDQVEQYALERDTAVGHYSEQRAKNEKLAQEAMNQKIQFKEQIEHSNSKYERIKKEKQEVASGCIQQRHSIIDLQHQLKELKTNLLPVLKSEFDVFTEGRLLPGPGAELIRDIVYWCQDAHSKDIRRLTQQHKRIVAEVRRKCKCEAIKEAFKDDISSQISQEERLESRVKKLFAANEQNTVALAEANAKAEQFANTIQKQTVLLSKTENEKTHLLTANFRLRTQSRRAHMQSHAQGTELVSGPSRDLSQLQHLLKEKEREADATLSQVEATISSLRDHNKALLQEKQTASQRFQITLEAANERIAHLDEAVNKLRDQNARYQMVVAEREEQVRAYLSLPEID